MNTLLEAGATLPITAETVSLILNIIFFVFLGFGLLWGLGRGLQKSGIRLLTFVGFLIIAAVVTPFITKALMNIQFNIDGSVQSLDSFILTQIQQVPEIEQLVGGSPTLQSFISQLPMLFVNIIVFLFMVYIIGLFGWFTYVIFKNALFKKKKIKDPKYVLEKNKPVMVDGVVKQKKYRLLGMLVGGVQGLLLMFATMLPFNGVIDFVNQMANATQTVSAEEVATERTPIAELINQYIPEDILKMLKAYDTSLIAKTSSVFGLDDTVFDYVSSITVDDERIVLRQELNTFVTLYDDVYTIYEAFEVGESEQFDLANLDFDKINHAIDTLFDSRILRTVAPELLTHFAGELNLQDMDETIPYVEDIDDLIDNFANYLETEPELMNTLKTDIKAVIGLAEIFVESGLYSEVVQEDVNIDDILDIISENDYEVGSNMITKLFSSKTLRTLMAEGINLGLAILEDTIQEMLPETETANFGRVDVNNISWDNTIQASVNFLKSGLEIYSTVKDINTENLSNDPTAILELDYEKIIDNAMIMLSTIFNSPLFESTVDDANVYNNIMLALNKTEFGTYLDFTVTGTTSFWTDNGDAVVGLIDCAKDIYLWYDSGETLEEYDFDYTQLSNAIDGILDSGLLSMVKDDALTYLKSNFLDQELETANPMIKTIVDNLFTNLESASSEGSIESIGNDIKSVINIVVELGESGIIDYAINSNEQFTIDDAKFIYNALSEKDSNNDACLTRIFNNIFGTTTLRSVFVDVANIGLDKVEEYLENEQSLEAGTIELQRLDFNDINWTEVASDIDDIINNFMSIEILETPYNLNVADIDVDIPFDIPEVLITLGETFDGIKNLELFKYDTNHNIINDILVELNNTTLANYVDFTIFVPTNAFSSEFTYYSQIVENIMDADIIQYFDSPETNIANIVNKLTENVTLADSSVKSRIKLILDPLFLSKAVDQLAVLAFDNADVVLDELDSILSQMTETDVDLGELNTSNFNNAEKLKLSAAIENLIMSISEVDLDKIFVAEPIRTDIYDAVKKIDYSKLGSTLDNIKSLSLFAPPEEETEGIYTNLIDVLKSLYGFEDIINFDIFKSSTFSFSEQFVVLGDVVKEAINCIPAENPENGMFAYVLNALATEIDVNETEMTRVEYFLTKVLKEIEFINVDKALEFANSDGLPELELMLSDLFGTEPATEVDLGQLNIDEYDADELIAVLKNAVLFVNDLNYSSTMTMDNIIEADFELLGNVLDGIKTLGLFSAPQPETEGFYSKLMDVVSDIAELNEIDSFVDVSQTTQASFVWTDELNKLKNIIIRLNDRKVTKDVDGVPTEKTFIELIVQMDIDSLIKNLTIEDSIVEDQTIVNDVDYILGNAIESKLLYKLVVTAINMANETVLNMIDPEAVVAEFENNDNELSIQKTDILDTFKTLLILYKDIISESPSVDFSNIQTLNNEKVTNMLNAFELNSTKNYGTIDEPVYNGVFKPFYNSILSFIITRVDAEIKGITGDAYTNTLPADITSQSTQIRNVMDKAIAMLADTTIDFANIDTLNNANLDNLFDALEANANANGVLKPAYNSILSYIVRTIDTETKAITGDDYINTLPADITAQSAQIRNVMDKAITMLADTSIDFTNIQTLDNANLDAFYDALEENANADGVLKAAYNSLLSYIVETVDSGVKEMTSDTYNNVLPADITSQSTQIRNVMDKAIAMITDSTIDFDVIETLDNVKMDNMYDALEENANVDGVFKLAYNSVLTFIVKSIDIEVQAITGDVYVNTLPADLTSQSTEVRNVLNKSLTMLKDNTINFAEIETLDNNNLNNFFDVLEANANTDGVFKPAYNSLLGFVVEKVDAEIVAITNSAYTNSFVGDLTEQSIEIRSIMDKAILLGSIEGLSFDDIATVDDADLEIVENLLDALKTNATNNYGTPEVPVYGVFADAHDNLLNFIGDKITSNVDFTNAENGLTYAFSIGNDAGIKTGIDTLIAEMSQKEFMVKILDEVNYTNTSIINYDEAQSGTTYTTYTETKINSLTDVSANTKASLKNIFGITEA